METNVQIIDAAGASTGQYAFKPEWLELEKGEQAVKDVVVAFLARLRAGTAATKTRGMVRGGGAKPWKQKGTGRARAGSNRSPIWRKGGITFGPQPRSYAKRVNRSVRRLALKRAFSERLQDQSVIIVEQIDLPAKTKAMGQFLDRIGAGRHALLVVDELTDAVVLSSRNLPDIELLKPSAVNPYWLLLFKKIVFTKSALDVFVKRLSQQEVEA